MFHRSASNAAKKPKVVDPDKERRKEKYRMLARKKRQNKDKGGDDAAKKEESKYRDRAKERREGRDVDEVLGNQLLPSITAAATCVLPCFALFEAVY